MEEFKIRLATPDDKEAILGIRDVYDGLDYLPAYYDHIIACSNVKAFVVEVLDTIIAFSVAYMVDDGLTVVSRAGRVNKQYSGQRVYFMLQEHLLKNSGAKENSFITLDCNPAVHLDSFKRENELIVSKDANRYDFNPQSIHTTKAPKNAVWQASDAYLKIYMTSESHRMYLFPNDVIIVDWVPFRLLPSNIPLMRGPGSINMLTNVEADGEQHKGLLSIATVYPVQDPPFAFVLEIYGEDAEALELHIECQIEFAQKHTKNDTVCCMVFCNEQLGSATVEKGFKKFGIKKREWALSGSCFTCTKQLLCRKPINQSNV